MATETSMPRPSDRWIPYYFFGFFTLLVLILVPMCIIAVRTSPGLVTENAYEKGLAYNKTIEAEQKLAQLHWQGDLQVGDYTNGHVSAEFRLKDADGKMLNDADVELWFVRPTQAKLDQKIKMTAKGDGLYAADIALAENGLWDARVSAKTSGQVFQLTKRIVLK